MQGSVRECIRVEAKEGHLRKRELEVELPACAPIHPVPVFVCEGQPQLDELQHVYVTPQRLGFRRRQTDVKEVVGRNGAVSYGQGHQR
jgi:hypothetical protein